MNKILVCAIFVGIFLIPSISAYSENSKTVPLAGYIDSWDIRDEGVAQTYIYHMVVWLTIKYLLL